MKTGVCYWRFKGDKAYKYGYCTHVHRNLYRMGCYNGDTSGGIIVDVKDIEVHFNF